MNALKLLPALMSLGLFSMATASMADEIIITHRSGKIQTIRIEQNGDPVEQVSFRRSKKEAQQVQQPASNAAAATKAVPDVATAPSPKATPPKVEEPAKAAERSGIKIKWAQPVDSM
ncbi:hypothetical protein [Trichlorobacter lovleyi]|uniref:hypothetical protein n=1 Tax=Trichlorobacter lovleyi TaxID=313985 RepID=UPI003D108D41